MNWADVQSSPAFGFTVVGLVIVFGPVLAERLRLPGLLELLFLGAVIGPNMLDVLSRFEGLQAVGSIGILYLIFLAGLQLDLETFVRYRVISGGFGLLTAFIPMALGAVVALLLDIDPLPAVLIGSFWASFTLIAYPTVAKYGLTKTRPVAAIVGASAITDGVSLVVLALVVGAETGDSSGARLVFDIALGFVVLGDLLFRRGPRDRPVVLHRSRRDASSASEPPRSGCCSRCPSPRPPPRWRQRSSASTSVSSAATWSTPSWSWSR